jgi:HSP20 family protein
MDLKKLVPWNWFRKEEEETAASLPVHSTGRASPKRAFHGPFGQLHQEMDQLFDNFFSGFGLSPSGAQGPFAGALTDRLLKPTLDIGANDKEYAISIEVPGVEQKDIKIEIADNTLTIRGEKKQEKEEKEKNYYRMERSYGAFQRVLSLPEDADQDSIKAKFKNGVLNITMPRKALPASNVKQIEIK